MINMEEAIEAHVISLGDLQRIVSGLYLIGVESMLR